MEVENLDFNYVVLIDKEEIDATELPSEIRKKIAMLKTNAGRYEKTPSDNLYAACVKMDVEICDLITNWLEESAEGSEEEDEEAAEAAAEAQRKADEAAAEAKKKADEAAAAEAKRKADEAAAAEAKRKADEAAVEAKKFGFGTKEMADAIKKSLINVTEKRILTKQLETIIGKKPEYPYQRVYNLVLKQVFMKSSMYYIEKEMPV